MACNVCVPTWMEVAAIRSLKEFNASQCDASEALRLNNGCINCTAGTQF
jgi:hypothetical protein